MRWPDTRDTPSIATVNHLEPSPGQSWSSKRARRCNSPYALARCVIGERMILLESRPTARSVRVVLAGSLACAAPVVPAAVTLGVSTTMSGLISYRESRREAPELRGQFTLPSRTPIPALHRAVWAQIV